MHQPNRVQRSKENTKLDGRMKHNEIKLINAKIKDIKKYAKHHAVDPYSSQGKSFYFDNIQQLLERRRQLIDKRKIERRLNNELV